MISPWSVQATTSKSSGSVSGLDHQAVVAGGLERVGQAAIDALAVVVDHEVLPCMIRSARTILRAEGVADALVAQADAQQRDSGGEPVDHVVGDPRLQRRARARRDDQVRWVPAPRSRRA